MVNPEDIKICIYTICKNEERFVNRWLASAQEADAIFINDTGSTDRTVELLEANPKVNLIHGKASGDKFRFDHAWNEVLEAIPDTYDLCFRLDMDMSITCGWCKPLKEFVANLFNNGKINPSTENINFPILVSFSNEIDFKKVNHMWMGLVHTYTKNMRYIGAVHEDHFVNDFKIRRSVSVSPYIMSIMHIDRENTGTKNDFYDRLAEIRFKEYPTYLNYLIYLMSSKPETFWKRYNLIDELLKEVSPPTNEALTRLEYSLNFNNLPITGVLYILYLKLLGKVFIEKSKEETDKVLKEIIAIEDRKTENSRKPYFNNCVEQLSRNLDSDEFRKYEREIKKCDKEHIYDYMVGIFSNYDFK